MSKILKGNAKAGALKVNSFAGQSATREPAPAENAATLSPDMPASQTASAPAQASAAKPDEHTRTPAAPLQSAARPAQPAPAQASVDDTALKAAKARLAQLEMEVEKQERQLEELTARSEALQAEAFEKGRLEGLRKSDESAGKRLTMLEQALQAVSNQQVQSHAQTEIVALQIAKAALGRMIGDPAQREGLLQQLIRHQIDHFAASKPSVLRVSPEDFPDASAFAEISAKWPDLSVVREKALKAGECQLTLELGEVEIGLPGQVARMSAFFDQLTEEQTVAPARARSLSGGEKA